MGWIFVNLVIPATLPLWILMLLKLVDMPEPYAARAKLLRTVRDGQLGWVAMGFSASCTYDLYESLIGAKAGTPTWAGTVFAIAIILLMMSGVLSMAGTLFPFDESKVLPQSKKDWVAHYKLFVGTAITTALTASLYAMVHYNLPVTVLTPAKI